VEVKKVGEKRFDIIGGGRAYHLNDGGGNAEWIEAINRFL